MRRLLLIFLLAFTAQVGRAEQVFPQTLDPADCKMFTAADGGTDADSPMFNVTPYGRISIQVSWAGLGGTIDATAQLQVSSVQTPASDADWVDKDGAVISISDTTDVGLISVTNLTEKWVRLDWTADTTSGGTYTATCHAKAL